MERHHPIAEDPLLQQVLSCFSETSSCERIVQRLSTGGFSGAQLWRVTCHSNQFCLRRWPVEHPSPDRLQFIHSVLRHVSKHGVSEIAIPIADRSGQTIVHADGALWELSHWKPGVADYHQFPNPTRLLAALQLLARFHIAAGRFAPAKVAAPTGLVSRYEQLKQLIAGGIKNLQAAVDGSAWPEAFAIAQQVLYWFPIVAPQIRQQLEVAMRYKVPLQPCIRDVWHDHILFSGDCVTGLVDFGALREDHVAGDIARLLGSLVPTDEHGWRQGLAAYEELRPLPPLERDLVSVYDRSATLLSGINWIRWLYLERRQFDDPHRVQTRLNEIGNRLVHLFH